MNNNPKLYCGTYAEYGDTYVSDVKSNAIRIK